MISIIEVLDSLGGSSDRSSLGGYPSDLAHRNALSDVSDPYDSDDRSDLDKLDVHRDLNDLGDQVI